MTISLEQAQTIVRAALEHGTEQGFQPLTVAVLDNGGALVALGRQDGSGYLRPDLATAKAWGILGMGINNRALAARAADSPDIYNSLVALAGGKIVSVPGGVFIRDAQGTLLGAVGVSGDASLNDEAAALAGIAAAGLVSETGAEG
ncbi:GlcG/HbpS family heme-binding protein [Pseudonocardia alaniniphila]|uniref:Heme-binding protein n=1 Tax=Pseudonocardia alaniniphila TaxID=75291 RepID=A0ABS9TCQ5_9PSEU|nr:heme-binding protein [Pseudonocardia alaniniphila]MCH6166071.1 heme-binding protein [Pseudonocardia alaniniphila]